ncbi:MAG: hypothetical protein SXQ77_04775 [Halobacteria archaeon]|nr:hypothetical protein [Halobacteria archaeon]
MPETEMDVEVPDVEELKQISKHESVKSLLGVGLGYGVILVVMTVLLFAIPYLIFALT